MEGFQDRPVALDFMWIRILNFLCDVPYRIHDEVLHLVMKLKFFRELSFILMALDKIVLKFNVFSFRLMIAFEGLKFLRGNLHQQLLVVLLQKLILNDFLFDFLLLVLRTFLSCVFVFFRPEIHSDKLLKMIVCRLLLGENIRSREDQLLLNRVVNLLGDKIILLACQNIIGFLI